MRRFAPPVPRRAAFVRLFLGTALAIGFALTTIQAQIPGRNINMVSGSTWPDGDPYLQRQNEPSIAASTRNPLHLLAGANDYRTVDLPGLPGDETGDAWLGLFKSFDGGQRWNSTLLPGYRQDPTAVGKASPIYGYSAGADPVVRAGTNGLVYYAGLVFDRSPAGSDIPGKSAIFVSRFIDNNNKEAGDPFAYLGTRTLATDRGGATGNFLDKPWMAVDIPRDGTRCIVTTPGEKGPITQNLPAGPVYVAYTLRSTDRQGPRYDIYFTRSADCGNTWTTPLRLNSPSERSNQSATLAIDPRNGNVFIAWRQFDLTGNNDAVMSVKFTLSTRKHNPPGFAHKFGKHKRHGHGKGLNPEHFYKKGGVNKAIEAAQLSPLDQATSDIAGLLAFRTNAYPSLTVDNTGRVYMAWAERGYEPLASDPVTGNARILVSSSLDGRSWTAPRAVAVEGQAGHQLMPTITFSGGKLMLVYYDLRESRSEVLLSRYIDDATALAGAKQRRHTMDLRASMGTPGAVPVFAPSVRVSDYMMGAGSDGVLRQLQVNPPNLPMFKQGTAPFMGDYVDVTAAPTFVVDAAGNWTYNNQVTSTLPVFHATWTDNRDVRPPLEDSTPNGNPLFNGDGNPWNNYTPPGALGNTASILDPTQLVGQCIPGNAGSRNQNIYTARITGGLLAGSPGNTKQLGYKLDASGQPTSELMQRAFVVFVQNTTPATATAPDATKTFRLSITGQPAGGRASFDQFSSAPLTVIDTVVPPKSTSSRTVYVTSTDSDARINITVTEVTAAGPLGTPVTGGLGSVIVLNPDIDNPDIDNPDIDNPDIDNPDIDNVEVYNPDIDNPDIDNPDIDNPDIDNPDIDNPDIDNVVVANPDIDNPDIDNPDIDNGNLLNPDIDNPDIDNPDIDNPDIDNASLTDVSWSITNTGNTSAAYNVNLFFAQTTIKPQLSTQLILYRTYRTPVVLNCQLKYETRNVLVANVPNPELVKSSTGDVSNPNDPDATNATIWLAPGESAKITLRVYDADKNDNVTVTNPDGSTASVDPTLVPNEDVTPVVQQQGVDTEDADAGQTEPPIVVQFPAPQTVPDAASTAPVTPVTINVLANDSTAFGSTKIMSLHPPDMASHSGGGPGDIAYQSSTGFLYTQRGIVDPVTNALVGRLALPPGNANLVYQTANQRTGINYGRTGTPLIGMVALDARPGSATFHQWLAMPQLSDVVLSFAIDAANGRLYAVHGPATATPSTPTTMSIIDINPANPTFHTVVGSWSLPAGMRGQSVAVNTRTQKVYLASSPPQGGTMGGVWVLDGTQPGVTPLKVANTFGAWSVVVNEASNMVFAATSISGNLFALHVIDGTSLAMTRVDTTFPMRFNSFDERLVVHIASGKVLMRLETKVVIVDGQRGSPTRNTIVGVVDVGRDAGQAEIVIDQELGVAVTAGSFDFRADLIDIAANALSETIALKAGSTDVDIDPINHRAFVAVPLTYVQEIDLRLRQATAEVPVFIESGGAVVNPITNRAYAGILGVGGSVGVVSGSGFNGSISLLNRESRFLFSTRYDVSNQYFIVNQGDPSGLSYGPASVVQIDGNTDTVANVVATLANPFGIGVNQSNGRLYVASLTGAGTPGGINVFDANNLLTPPVQATLAPGFPLNTAGSLVAFGRHVVVNPNTGKVYAMQVGGSPTSLVVLDPTTDVITPLDGLTSPPPNGLPAAPAVPPGATPAPGAWGRVDVIRVDAGQNRIYLGMFDAVTNTNRIVALDGNTDQVVASWVGGKHSNRHTASYVIVNQGADRIYVSNYDTNAVTMLDTTGLNLTPISTTALPAGPSAMAFNETSNRLYVSSINSKMLTALDGTTLALQSTVRMPLVAQFLYVDEVESRIYTSGGDSSDESGLMVITDVLGQLGTNVTVTGVTQPDNGVAVLNADMSITYTPDPGFQGLDSFGYNIAAPTGTASGVVNISVVAANPVSVAFADSYATPINQNLTVAAPGPMANDATGDPAATMVVDTFPTNGVLTPQPDGSFTYQPNPGFLGLDKFEYHTLGALGVSNTIPVGITVTGGTNLVVTNTNDAGVGSLRQAMLTANVEPGSTITFAITTGTAPYTIQPASALPTMNVPVTINGYTQTGATANTLTVGTNADLKIVLRGPAAGASGLSLMGGNSTVRGLVINGFTGGSGIRLDSTQGGDTVEGNFIGTDVSGTVAIPNGTGLTVNAPGVTVGGSAVGARNLVAGNAGAGISVGTSYVPETNAPIASGTGSVIRGNYVGVNAAGTALLTNTQCGICSFAASVTIGGPDAGDGNLIAGGSLSNGINLSRQLNGNEVINAAGASVVEGNTIGLNAAGTARLNAPGMGIYVSSADNQIVGNVVAGNGTTVPLVFAGGISLSGSFATGNSIRGNTIGTNLAGATGLGNSSSGISLRGASNNTIGGLNLADRNVIVGNGGNGGIEFYAFSGDTMTGNVIQGNYIGVLADGTTIPNNTGMRIYANPPSGPNPAGVISGNTIGGSVAAARNVISGNNGDGINLGGTGTTNNAIVGNYIGVAANGTTARGNTGTGVNIGDASNTSVGGTSTTDGNLIAFNSQRGVAVQTATATGNRILTNRIFGNGLGLGIDLGSNGITNNDGGDGDLGPNNLQNFPVLSGASNDNGATTTVNADLSSFMVGSYTVQFFASTSCGASRHGERFIGSAMVTQLGGTNLVLNEAVPTSDFITATATDANGNTSEFSACAQVNPPTVVTTNSDSGTGSLRSAMEYANATPGVQSISFNIPGAAPASPAVIQVAAPLPVIMEAVTIDATTQPGYDTQPVNDRRPVIELTGSPAATVGLQTTTDVPSVTIRGLAITNFSAYGIYLLQAENGPGNLIQANTIGTDRNGSAGKGNGTGLMVRTDNSTVNGNVIAGNLDSGIRLETDADNVAITGNKIGMAFDGVTPLGNGTGIRMYDSLNNTVIAGNVISANSGWGIDIQDSLAGDVTDTIIQGNTIGLNANGQPAGNTAGGISLNKAPGSVIGAPGVGNVISGNGGAGVSITGGAAAGILVQANKIGSDAAGQAARGNSGPGIRITASAVVVGWKPGDPAGTGNLISGNGGDGIQLIGPAAVGNQVRGNLIGTNAAGTAALGSNVPVAALSNYQAIYITGNGNVIGGSLPSERNILSGNRVNGVFIDAAGASANQVVGNYIGTDATGTSAIANGWDGVGLIGAPANFITGNVVSGNARYGFYVTGNANTIAGNEIGTAAGGTNPLGNGAAGIYLSASTTMVGGAQPNIIAFNAGAGVWVVSGAGNQVRGNAIRANNGLGIDKGGLGITPTFPVVSAAVNGGSTTSVNVDISMFAVGTYSIEFFASVTCDPSGYGEGERWVGTANVVQPGGSANLTELVPVGQFITATATDASGNTSEFSACTMVSAQGPTISTIFPNPAAAGFGQLVWIRGTNLPGTSASDILFSQGGPEFSAQYTWTANSNLVIARLPPGVLSPGAANVRIKNTADTVSTPMTPITISTTPGTPQLLKAMAFSCSAGGTTDALPGSVTSGQEISIKAEGIDTTGAQVRFTHSSEPEVISSVTCTTGADGGVSAGVTTPRFGPGTVSITIRTFVNGVPSAWSNPTVQNIIVPSPDIVTVDATDGGLANLNFTGTGTAPATGITLAMGQTVMVTATGLVGWYPGPNTATPAGRLDLPTEPTFLAPSLTAISLVARINGGPWQYVGPGPTILGGPGLSGLIEFAVNDSDYTAELGQTGTFTVTIQR